MWLAVSGPSKYRARVKVSFLVHVVLEYVPDTFTAISMIFALYIRRMRAGGCDCNRNSTPMTTKQVLFVSNAAQNLSFNYLVVCHYLLGVSRKTGLAGSLRTGMAKHEEGVACMLMHRL